MTNSFARCGRYSGLAELGWQCQSFTAFRAPHTKKAAASFDAAASFH
jgi:hypothetical protein